MFRTLRRLLFPNPLDVMLKRCRRRGGKKILLGWNRGLGDIALGLFAIVQRIRELVPDAEVTFLTRENLRDGFSLLEGIKTLVVENLQRGQEVDVKACLRKLGRDLKEFDLIIKRPSPTDWVRWQRGRVVPKLKWDGAWDRLWEKFSLPDGFIYIGLQPVVETNYGVWRNWPLERWQKLFDQLAQVSGVKIILFGSEDRTVFSNPNIIDLRGKTTLFELLSVIKNKCRSVILQDSGILSMVYYLDAQFPLQVISLWADPNHGILKQNVASPNRKLNHCPLVGKQRDLSKVSVEQVLDQLSLVEPLKECPFYADVTLGEVKNVGSILLAGGQGSRLGFQGPKGTFSICGKSLFEWICEKVPKTNFPIAVMTSPVNHEETVRFFAKHENFGREVYFFQQEMQPFFNEQKQKTQEMAPQGNGAVFKAFARSGLLDAFTKRGIDLLTIVPVDNPLADPSDRFLIGHARHTRADVTVKCVKRDHAQEMMGALVKRAGRLEIVEYMDLDPEIEYVYSNTGMLAFSIRFFSEMVKEDLPLHFVKKKMTNGTWGWKGEQFIFDVLSKGIGEALWYPKKQCYAPIKGPESVEKVRQVLEKIV